VELLSVPPHLYVDTDTIPIEVRFTADTNAIKRLKLSLKRETTSDRAITVVQQVVLVEGTGGVETFPLVIPVGLRPLIAGSSYTFLASINPESSTAWGDRLADHAATGIAVIERPPTPAPPTLPAPAVRLVAVPPAVDHAIVDLAVSFEYVSEGLTNGGRVVATFGVVTNAAGDSTTIGTTDVLLRLATGSNTVSVTIPAAFRPLNGNAEYRIAVHLYEVGKSSAWDDAIAADSFSGIVVITPEPTPPPTDPAPCANYMIQSGLGGTAGTKKDSPRAADVDEKHAVTCCSDTALPGFAAPEGDCMVWAARGDKKKKKKKAKDGDSGGGFACLTKVSWSEAVAHCEVVGARLCRADELVSGCAVGQKCKFKNKMVWSSTKGRACVGSAPGIEGIATSPTCPEPKKWTKRLQRKFPLCFAQSRNSGSVDGASGGGSAESNWEVVGIAGWVVAGVVMAAFAVLAIGLSTRRDGDRRILTFLSSSDSSGQRGGNGPGLEWDGTDYETIEPMPARWKRAHDSSAPPPKSDTRESGLTVQRHESLERRNALRIRRSSDGPPRANVLGQPTRISGGST